MVPFGAVDDGSSSARDEASRPSRRPVGLVSIEAGPVDWSGWYLTDEDDMGEGAEQGEIIRMLLSCLAMLARERRWQNRMLAGDQFFAWRRDQPLVRVSPDVYVVDGPPPPPLPRSWQTWLPGHVPPTVAFEVVSDDWQKDYEAPLKYSQLGCPELVVFDPDVATGAIVDPHRVALQVWRREADGALAREYWGSGPARVDGIDAWVVVALATGPVARLRIARDDAGTDLVPTAEERVAQLEAELRRRP